MIIKDIDKYIEEAEREAMIYAKIIVSKRHDGRIKGLKGDKRDEKRGK